MILAWRVKGILVLRFIKLNFQTIIIPTLNNFLKAEKNGKKSWSFKYNTNFVLLMCIAEKNLAII